MKAKIFAAPINYTIERHYQKEEDELLIGVDKGAFHALEKGLCLDVAVGDFDSVTAEEFEHIKEKTPVVKVFAEAKAKTDTDIAIEEAFRRKAASVTVYGGIGRRLDHTYGNFLFLRRGDVTFVTDNQLMRILTPGEHRIVHDYDFISFFAVERVQGLDLEDFAYELKNYDLAVDDPLCISNEGQGVVRFRSGLLLMIAAND